MGVVQSGTIMVAMEINDTRGDTLIILPNIWYGTIKIGQRGTTISLRENKKCRAVHIGKE